MHLQSLLLASLAISFPVAFAPEGDTAARSAEAVPAGLLELTYLANEGFLLRAGSHAVLIDAFVAEPYSSYAGLSAEAAAALLAGEAPFASLDLALTSHAHPDHFQAAFACEVLSAHAELPFVTTPDVVAKLLAHCPTLASRVTALFPDEAAVHASEQAGIGIELLRLSHGTGRFRDVQNLGHAIDLDGLRVLHLGDADMSPGNFAPYRLGERSFDVALVPYWYARHPSGKRFLANLRTRHLVLVHVPPDEVGVTRQYAARHYPQATVFGACLERRVFDCRDARAPEGSAAPADVRDTPPETPPDRQPRGPRVGVPQQPGSGYHASAERRSP